MNVQHIDEFYEMSDQRLAFEQAQCIVKIEYCIHHNDDKNLEIAIDECKRYTEVIRQRQANYLEMLNSQQLSLFPE